MSQKIGMLYKKDGKSSTNAQLWPKRVVTSPDEGGRDWTGIPEVDNSFHLINILPSNQVSNRGQGAKVIQA